MSKTKVLQVVDTLYTGGLEMVVKNILLYTKDSFDNSCLVCCDNETDFEAELREKGIKIYHIPTPDTLKQAFYRNLLSFFREHNDFSLVHVHMSFSCGIVAKAAKKNGIKVVVSHSHEMEREKDRHLARRFYAPAMRSLILRYSDAFLACSKGAGDFLFTGKVFSEKGKVFLNGVDTARFAFNPETREKVRRELGLEYRTVLGAVGSLITIKNHKRIVEMLKYNGSFAALIVGEGITRTALTELAEKEGVSDRLLLPGKHSDIEYYLNAMDIFVFPSVSEGFPVALVEAQANGLPCLVSEAIQKESYINENVEGLKLADSPQKWAEKAEQMAKLPRITNQGRLKERGLDLRQSMSDLENLYQALLSSR